MNVLYDDKMFEGFCNLVLLIHIKKILIFYLKDFKLNIFKTFYKFEFNFEILIIV